MSRQRKHCPLPPKSAWPLQIITGARERVLIRHLEAGGDLNDIDREYLINVLKEEVRKARKRQANKQDATPHDDQK